MGNVFHIIQLGGSVMYALVIVAWVALTMLILRLWKTRASVVFPMDGGKRWIELAREGELKPLREAANDGTSAARIARAGADEILENPNAWDESSLKQAIEDAGRRELSALERFNGSLATIASISPLIGLLGTVFGLISMFQGLSNADGSIQRISAELLADGIWKALLTTAAGLVVAIPALLGFKLLGVRVQGHAERLEDFSSELLRRLTRATRG